MRLVDLGPNEPVVSADPTLLTFRDYAQGWLSERESEGLRCVRSYRQILTCYLYPVFGGRPLSQITKAEHKAFAVRLRTAPSERREFLSARSIRNVLALFRVLMNDAVEDELIARAPVARSRRLAPKIVDSDPSWRPKAYFSTDEVRMLCADDRLRPQDQVLNTLAFFTGARISEMSALLWNAWEPELEPLGRLTIAWSYSTLDRVRRPPKTGDGRSIPVHPELAAMLERWYLHGWKKFVGRAPGPGDLILPSCVRGKTTLPLRNDTAASWFERDIKKLGLRHRGLHCSRATFISLLIENGVDPTLVATMTHSASELARGLGALGGYARFAWKPLCAAIRLLPLEIGGAK